MRRLLTSATNADECRLIVDIFLAQSGLLLEPVEHAKPSPPSDTPQPLSAGTDADLEHSLVELFLGGAGEEESEVEGDEHVISSADSAASKGSSVSLPMSPPDTPGSSHGNGVKAAEPAVVKDSKVPTP